MRLSGMNIWFRRLSIVFALFLATFNSVFSQETSDSEAKLNNLFQATRMYLHTENDSVILFADSLYELSVKHHNITYQLRAMRHQAGGMILINGDTENGIKLFEKGIQLSIDSAQNNELFGFRNDLSVHYRRLGENQKAIELNLENELLASKIDNKNMQIFANHSLGTIFIDLEETEKAIQHFKVASHLSKETGNEKMLGHSESAMGTAYIPKNKDSAIYHLNQASVAFSNSNFPQFHHHARANIAEVYLDDNQVDSAYRYISTAIPFFSNEEHTATASYSFEVAGKVYEAMDKPDSAFLMYQGALDIALKFHIIRREKNLHQLLSNHYYNSGEYKNAYDHMKRHWMIHDSLFTIEKDKTIRSIYADHEVEKKEAELTIISNELALQKTKNQLQDSERQWLSLLITLIVLVATGIVSFLLYRRKREREKALHKLMLKEVELKGAQSKIELKEQKLTAMKNEIILKNNAVEELESKLLKDSENKQFKMVKLSNMKILTEEDWDRFKRMFLEVHPEFLGNPIFEEFKFSTSEVRFLMLTKIKLSNKEIASCLGISMGGARTTKYRIIKKTKSHGIETIEDLIDKI